MSFVRKEVLTILLNAQGQSTRTSWIDQDEESTFPDNKSKLKYLKRANPPKGWGAKLWGLRRLRYGSPAANISIFHK